MGIVMYADDILLLSPSVRGLQMLLNKCFSFFTDHCLQFNTSKSNCMAIGKASTLALEPLILQEAELNWCDSFKYLGVNFATGKQLMVNTDTIKRKIFAACNSILSKTREIDELTRLSLIESSCLPILTYAISALNLSEAQVNDLNIAWNSVYRNIFGFHRWESVKECIAGLGHGRPQKFFQGGANFFQNVLNFYSHYHTDELLKT